MTNKLDIKGFRKEKIPPYWEVFECYNSGDGIIEYALRCTNCYHKIIIERNLLDTLIDICYICPVCKSMHIIDINSLDLLYSDKKERIKYQTYFMDYNEMMIQKINKNEYIKNYDNEENKKNKLAIVPLKDIEKELDDGILIMNDKRIIDHIKFIINEQISEDSEIIGISSTQDYLFILYK